MSGTQRDLFKGTAWYYARYRPPYPDAFFAHVVQAFNLDGTGRMLDLGCGTGELAIPLSRHFHEVVGMDPYAEMLAEAQPRRAGAANVVWLQGGSDDLRRFSPRLGRLRLVTMGSSFHWMDRDATLEALAELVVPGGGIVVTGFGSIPWNSDHDWQAAIREVIRRWLGDVRRAGSSTYVEPHERHEQAIARSAFGRMKTWTLDYQRTWDIETIIGYLYSTSFCSRHVLGGSANSFEKNLRETLLALDPAGQFVEPVHLEAYLAWLD